MSDQFIAEIRIFPFNFPPTGWAFCDGQLIPTLQNDTLFGIIGTIYGGNGTSNFALPNLQGAAAMQAGQGQGLSARQHGQSGGVENVTLLVSEIPVHTHTLLANSIDPANLNVPRSDASVGTSTGGAMYVQGSSFPPLVPMAFQALPPAGGSLPHNNMQPYLTLNFCIALSGIIPQRP